MRLIWVALTGILLAPVSLATPPTQCVEIFSSSLPELSDDQVLDITVEVVAHCFEVSGTLTVSTGDQVWFSGDISTTNGSAKVPMRVGPFPSGSAELSMRLGEFGSAHAVKVSGVYFDTGISTGISPARPEWMSVSFGIENTASTSRFGLVTVTEGDVSFFSEPFALEPGHRKSYNLDFTVEAGDHALLLRAGKAVPQLATAMVPGYASAREDPNGSSTTRAPVPAASVGAVMLIVTLAVLLRRRP